MATQDIVPKSEETWKDRLKSRKVWLGITAVVIAILKLKWPDLNSDAINQAVLSLLGVAGLLTIEDTAKHLRDGKIAMAEAAKAHAEAVLKTGDLPKLPQ